MGRKGDGAEVSARHPHPTSSALETVLRTCGLLRNTKLNFKENTLVVCRPRTSQLLPPPFPPPSSLSSQDLMAGEALVLRAAPHSTKGALPFATLGEKAHHGPSQWGPLFLILSLSPPASPPAAPGSSRCLPWLIMPCHAATELWSHTGFTCHK